MSTITKELTRTIRRLAEAVQEAEAAVDAARKGRFAAEDRVTQLGKKLIADKQQESVQGEMDLLEAFMDRTYRPIRYTPEQLAERRMAELADALARARRLAVAVSLARGELRDEGAPEARIADALATLDDAALALDADA